MASHQCVLPRTLAAVHERWLLWQGACCGCSGSQYGSTCSTSCCSWFCRQALVSEGWGVARPACTGTAALLWRLAIKTANSECSHSYSNCSEIIQHYQAGGVKVYMCYVRCAVSSDCCACAVDGLAVCMLAVCVDKGAVNNITWCPDGESLLYSVVCQYFLCPGLQ
jgi:hypothetical protein